MQEDSPSTRYTMDLPLILIRLALLVAFGVAFWTAFLFQLSDSDIVRANDFAWRRLLTHSMLLALYVVVFVKQCVLTMWRILTTRGFWTPRGHTLAEGLCLYVRLFHHVSLSIYDLPGRARQGVPLRLIFFSNH